MDTTICPWCQTEIVWDEELGPEEECPYCHNELKGYRTLNIALGSDEELEEEDEPEEEDLGIWEEDDESHLNAIRRLEAFGAVGGDLLAYESGVEKILDHQEEVPECPHCREYMMYAGSRSLGPDYIPVVPEGLKAPLLKQAAKLNVYVCTACFHVGSFLSEEDRNALIRAVSQD
ncbi:hypothetical protein DFP94_109161 [Fontibacillus phaseoli]|uniref:Uncharacterized protein n=1 Tax=Fontibacillus phaseoli TaxID=1416533 RepID=A0A369BA42_9BACL|nr:hypothetical protein [Fontibacillus phaseoli]RCX17436.1 hypothetical protein DFP94_109161 [Fontibacillus phaseoli]